MFEILAFVSVADIAYICILKNIEGPFSIGLLLVDPRVKD